MLLGGGGGGDAVIASKTSDGRDEWLLPQSFVPNADVWTTGQATTTGQGLTLVHFSAQRQRFLWDRGCI